MSAGELQRDDNSVPVAGGVSSTDSEAVLPLKINPVTGRLLTDNAGGGSGTVTDVSVVTANGFAGTVANSTTTPEITLTTTVTGILSGNGTAISAASTTGSGNVVLATSPTITTPTIAGATLTGVIDAGGADSFELPNGNAPTVNANGEIAVDNSVADFDEGVIKYFSVAEMGVVALPVAQFTAPTGGHVVTYDATENAFILAATPGGGTVDTVVGTANRITVDSTDPANPIVDIAATYVGQTSITTLGTIATGTWNGTAVAGQYGGTGVANTGKTITVSGNTVIGSNSDTVTFATTGATSVTLPTSGTLATTTYVPTAITVANEGTDTTCFPLFVTAATGDLGPKTNAGLTFNSNTALLTATLIAGTTSVTSATIRASSDDSGSIGVSGTAFSDLFLASGALIDFAAGNSVITHSSAVLTVSTGDLRVTTAGTNSASVVTVGGTQTLTSKTLTSPTITTATLSGAQQLAEGASIRLDAAGSADGAYSGITISGTAGATLAFGDLIYLAAADSRWELTDADAASTANVLIGMCVLAAASDGDPTVVLLQGNIRADAAFPAMTISARMYMGETAGDIQATIPTGADAIIRAVGYALTADELYFCPSMDSQATVA